MELLIQSSIIYFKIVIFITFGIIKPFNNPFMQEVTLKIPDQKLAFFLELIKQLGLEVSEGVIISEEQMNMVRERIRKSNQNPERLLDWEHVQDNFQFD